MDSLSFMALRAANDTRQGEWPGNDQADVAFRAIEVAGEFGEVSEAIKKHLRAERGIKGSTATIEDVADEMADAIIALDLLASELRIDLGEAVARKFNKTSEKYGMATRLPVPEGGEQFQTQANVTVWLPCEGWKLDRVDSLRDYMLDNGAAETTCYDPSWPTATFEDCASAHQAEDQARKLYKQFVEREESGDE